MSQSVTPEAQDAAREAAIAWQVRIQSDLTTADDWSALSDWLEESEDHQAAFDAVEALAAELADKAPAIAAGLAPASAQIVPFPARPRRISAPWSLAAAAAAAAVIVAPVAWQGYRGAETVYQTPAGQTRQIALADGTRIHLDAGSTLKVRLGWRTRNVEMAEAEASFDVAKDPRRPFLISVGDQQVRVVGTEFNIRHFGKQVVVTVRRGIVEVRQPALGAAPVARLTVGDSLRHTEGAAASSRARVDPNLAFAWTEGRLIYEDERLADITADLTRRYGAPITAAPAAGERRFSGVLELGEQSAVVDRLARYMSLAVDRTGGKITLR